MQLSTPKASEEIEHPDIRVMSIECEKVGGINLSQGVCDTPTPPAVLAGAKAAMDKGLNHYTRYDGIPELRKAIAQKADKFNHIKADAESEIVVSAGATGALFSAMLALLQSGDEVVLFEPYYGYHLQTILAVGARPRYVRTTPPDWNFELADLERAITPKTKAIILNTPSNPSGKVFTREELNQIADVCEKHDLLVFTDEIYEYFTYDGVEHISPASLPKLRGRTITISGPSKTFSITGWRVGYCICGLEQKERIGNANDLLYVCSPSPLQAGVAAGMESLPASFYESLCKMYKTKRDMLCQTLKTAGLTPYVPKGAYYVLADVSRLPGSGSKEKAMHLLRTAGVATVPGRAFYHDKSGEHLVRFCFAKNDSDLQEACARLRKLKI